MHQKCERAKHRGVRGRLVKKTQARRCSWLSWEDLKRRNGFIIGAKRSQLGDARERDPRERRVCKLGNLLEWQRNHFLVDGGAGIPNRKLKSAKIAVSPLLVLVYALLRWQLKQLPVA